MRRVFCLLVAVSFLALALSLPALPRASAGALLFMEDFQTDPTTNGKWQPFREAGDPANELSWVSASDPFYLTRAHPSRAGAIFANHALVERYWEASFLFSMGGGSLTPADGITMPFYAHRDVESGFANGFAGPGYAIELDVYHNDHDPVPGPHVAILENDATTHLAWVPAPVLLLPGWHRLTVVYTDGLVQVDVDGLNLFHQIAAPAYQHDSIGLAASTGGSTNDHMVDDFTLHSLAEELYGGCYPFGTDPNTNGGFTVHRHANDPASEVVWDGAAGLLHLTTAQESRGGAIFSKGIMPSGEWIASFRFRIAGGSGADGISMPFYATPGVSGGEDVGFKAPGFAIELDTFPNPGDPTGAPHTAIVVDHGSGRSVVAYRATPSIVDGQWHQLNVTHTVGAIIVSLDGVPIVMGDIANYARADIRWGLAASTGAFTNDHMVDDLCLFWYSPTESPDEASLPGWDAPVAARARGGGEVMQPPDALTPASRS